MLYIECYTLNKTVCRLQKFHLRKRKKFLFTMAYTFLRNYRFLLVRFVLTARVLLDLYAKTGNRWKENTTGRKISWQPDTITQKVISGIIS